MRTMWDGKQKDEPYRELISDGHSTDRSDQSDLKVLFWICYTVLILVSGIVVGVVVQWR